MFLYKLCNVFYSGPFGRIPLDLASINKVNSHKFHESNLSLQVDVTSYKFENITVEINMNENETLYENDVVNKYLVNNKLIEIHDPIPQWASEFGNKVTNDNLEMLN